MLYSIFSLDWNDFVLFKIHRWKEFYVKWLKEGRKVMVVVYENLTNNDMLRHHLYDILDFMNFKVDLSRIECTIKHSEGKFHRNHHTCIKKKVTDRGNEDYSTYYEKNNDITNDIFTNDHKLVINMAIDTVNEALVKRGFNPLPIDDYKNTKIKLKICG